MHRLYVVLEVVNRLKALFFLKVGFNLFCIMLQMTKKIKKLEKETTMYRSRWESSNKALLEMAEEVIVVLRSTPVLFFVLTVKALIYSRLSYFSFFTWG